MLVGGRTQFGFLRYVESGSQLILIGGRPVIGWDGMATQYWVVHIKYLFVREKALRVVTHPYLVTTSMSTRLAVLSKQPSRGRGVTSK